MKRLIAALSLAFLLAGSEYVDAQVLVKRAVVEYGGIDALYDNGAMAELDEYTLFDRFRERHTETLAPGKMSKELKCVIEEKNEDGTYLALFRTPLNGNFGGIDSFIATLYKKNKKVDKEINLSELAGFEDCEVQDVHYKDGLLYFNMPYISYSSGANGNCSSLYCYDPESELIVWESPYLCSNGSFLVEENYIICGYGFTSEKDFVYLIDRNTGKVLTQMPMRSKPVYYEFSEDGELLVLDYNSNMYRMAIEDKGLMVTGEGVRLRLGPSLQSEIFSIVEDPEDVYLDEEGNLVQSETEPARVPVYAMKGDILTYLGKEGDFYKVKYNDEPVYIYHQYGKEM